jgi:hypothetical protein
MLAQLDPHQIALADPRFDWTEKLHLLRSEMQLATDKRI